MSYNRSGAIPQPWAPYDFWGTGQTVGGTFYDNGVITLNTCGIQNSTADNFGGIFQLKSGDFTLIAKINGIFTGTGTNFPSAGIGVRESSAAGSKFIEAEIEHETGTATYPSGEKLYFVKRTTTNGALAVSGSAVTGQSFPIWLKITRTGGTSWAGFYSTNGSSYTQLGNTETLTLTDPVLVGIYGTTGAATGVGIGSANISNLTVF